MKKHGWKTIWSLLAAAGAGLFLRSEYEREQISVETTEIETDKISKDVKLVFLSDLHSHEFGRNNERLLAAVNQVNPDVILVGGDMMVCKGSAKNETALRFLRKLTMSYPVYYGNGNHETRMKRERTIYGDAYERYVKKLKAMGVVVLENRTECFRGDIAITGIDLDDRFYGKFSSEQLTAGEIEDLGGKAQTGRYQILLCHSPMYFNACRQWGADLTLSGHFHGGTIRLPFFGGVMTPQYQFFLPWCGGAFVEEGKTMLVSRGLGTHSINIRINNKPQIVVAVIKKKKA